MESYELLREAFEKRSAKEVAAEMGLSLSMIYKWAEPPDDSSGSGAVNPLDRVAGLVRATNDERIVQWLCQRANGFFIRNPKSVHPVPDYLIPATNSVIQQFAELLAVVAVASDDKHITKQEAKMIRAR